MIIQRMINQRQGKRFCKNFVVSVCIFHEKYLIMPLCYWQRTHTVAAETDARNLHPRPQRDSVDNENEEIDEDLHCEPIGDFLCANEGISSCLLLYLPAISYLAILVVSHV
jgi:hypothetical protein